MKVRRGDTKDCDSVVAIFKPNETRLAPQLAGAATSLRDWLPPLPALFSAGGEPL